MFVRASLSFLRSPMSVLSSNTKQYFLTDRQPTQSNGLIQQCILDYEEERRSLDVRCSTSNAVSESALGPARNAQMSQLGRFCQEPPKSHTKLSFVIRSWGLSWNWMYFWKIATISLLFPSEFLLYQPLSTPI